jgi:NADPH:quinone reductase-like Zn-dependent oxidoreductase
MRAAVRERYGGPVEITDVGEPALDDDRVLVRVRATSINRGDWYALAGKPVAARPMMGGIRRPKNRMLGGDFAGVVEAVGRNVTEFKAGDEVFGGRAGAFAEYATPKDGLALKPPNVTFEEAAAVPIAALTALQGLRDHGKLQAGQRVLVNGASGGVGTFAIQIAKALGAHVTAVCSTRNVEQARSLGADEVIDYSKRDFTRTGERYDLILDVAGSKSWRACKRVLARDGRLVIVGGPGDTLLLGPLAHIAATKLMSLGSSRKTPFFIAKFNRADMDFLRDLLADGKIRPVIDRRYAFGEIGDALREMGKGHVQGKLVVTI